MARETLSEYQQLRMRGLIKDAELFLLGNLEQIGYGAAVDHLWRFHSFDAFDAVRAELNDKLSSGGVLPWQAVELLYYLNENKITGDPEKDRLLRLEEIFALMCKIMAETKNGRDAMVVRGFVNQGLFLGEEAIVAPSILDDHVAREYGLLPHLIREIMGAAFINRVKQEKLVLDESGWGSKIEKSRCAEIYIGPYFFRAMKSDQMQRAKIPDYFESPFRAGLIFLIEYLLSKKWQVLPVITWRGGLCPKACRIGSISFSYHTHGCSDGCFHYKFGHYSDVMTIDPRGYAGFSSFSDDVFNLIDECTKNIPRDVLVSTVEAYRARYVDGRISWRIQKDSLGALIKGRKTVFFALQDPFDEVSRLAYLNVRDVFYCLQKSLSCDDVIYIKRHPVDASYFTDALVDEFSADSRVRFVDCSIHDIFTVVDLVVTINSGVGFEALLAGLPVIAAGKSDYNIAVRSVKTVDELLEALCEPWTVNEELRLKFLYVYFEYYALNPRDSDRFTENLARQLSNYV